MTTGSSPNNKTGLGLPRPVGFVLSGGASLGSVQVGMLKALDAAGVKPDFVVGTSVGALNGAILASNPESAATRLTEIWLEMERGDVFPGHLLGALWRLGRTKTYAVDNTGLEAIASRALNADTFEELQVPLGVITTDLTDNAARLLHTGALVQALLASSALPGVFPPVRRDDHLLVDGSILADIAVDQALEFGAAGSLVTLDCMVPPPDAEPDSVADMLEVVSNLRFRAQLQTALGQVEQRVPVVCMPAPGMHRVSSFDFGQTAALMDEAGEAGAKFLDQLDIRGPGLYGDPYTRYTGPPAGTHAAASDPA